LSWLHPPRNLQVDFYPWHKLVLVQTRQKIERASELVRKSLHLFSLLPPWISSKCRVDIDGLILESLHPSICSVEISTWIFGLQVAITGWSSKVRLGFDTSMLHVSWLVRILASVGVLR
jgi:hypothetical protein